MDLKLFQGLGRWGRSRSDDPMERGLHLYSDSALHTTLMIAVVAIATLAVMQALSVGVRVWQLETVVVQGKATQVPLPAAPSHLPR